MSHPWDAGPAPRIGLLRPDHLGDVLLSLPALVWLREVVPWARITAVVSPALSGIARRCPAVDTVVSAPFPAPTAPASDGAWEAAVARLAPRLAGLFDVALLPRIDDPWSGQLALAAGIPLRVGFDHPATRRYLTHALPVPQRRHVTRLAFAVAGAAVDCLGVGATSEEQIAGPWIVPTAEDVAEAGALLASVNLDLDAPLVVVHPGAGWPLKSWPAERWGAVAAGIAGRGFRVLVSGGSEERACVAEVVAAAGGHAVSVAGELTLGGLAGLMQRAAVVVANDSGPLHLAAAVGTPVVGLYGPADPAEFGPWLPPDRVRVVQPVLACSPCRTMLDPPCGARSLPACLLELTARKVLDAFDELASINRRRQPLPAGNPLPVDGYR